MASRTPADTADAQDVEVVVRAFLEGSLDSEPLDRDADVFALGYVNSLFALELVTFVERRFGVEVDTDDLELDNFRSIAAIANFVRVKLTVPDEPTPQAGS